MEECHDSRHTTRLQAAAASATSEERCNVDYLRTVIRNRKKNCVRCQSVESSVKETW
jgi:hypothetical protein